jgi:hypothetical protein
MASSHLPASRDCLRSGTLQGLYPNASLPNLFWRTVQKREPWGTMAPISFDHMMNLLKDPQSVSDLRRYFDADASAFSGRKFDSLGRREDDPDRFTAADLIAVQCLSVTVPVEVAIDLLEGGLGPDLSELLGEIPTNIELGTEDSRPRVEHDSSADQAWHLLKKQEGVGWVTAGKLLARKRPRLIPVWDHVVRCALGCPDHAWLWLDGRLREQDGAIRDQLCKLHQEVGLPLEVSLLRTLDVVVWMRHRDSHRPSRCPGLRLARQH